MLKSREWLLIFGIALLGGVGTMVYRAMMMAFRIVTGIAGQSISAVLYWAVIGLVVVFLLRLRSAREPK